MFFFLLLDCAERAIAYDGIVFEMFLLFKSHVRVEWAGQRCVCQNCSVCDVNVYFIAKKSMYMHGEDACFIVRCCLIPVPVMAFHVDYDTKLPVWRTHIARRQWNQDAVITHARFQ